MKYIYLILITAILNSCGIPLPLQKDLVVKDKNSVRINNTSNPVFASFIEEFELKGKAITGNPKFTIGDVPINFGDTENPKFQGVCFTYPSSGKKEIIIQKSWWDKTKIQSFRESLIFHELGHCVLDRDHLDDRIGTAPDTYKASMMNMSIVTPDDYEPHKDEYLEELFTSDQTNLLTTLGITP